MNQPDAAPFSSSGTESPRKPSTVMPMTLSPTCDARTTLQRNPTSDGEIGIAMTARMPRETSALPMRYQVRRVSVVSRSGAQSGFKVWTR